MELVRAHERGTGSRPRRHGRCHDNTRLDRVSQDKQGQTAEADKTGNRDKTRGIEKQAREREKDRGIGKQSCWGVEQCRATTRDVMVNNCHATSTLHAALGKVNEAAKQAAVPRVRYQIIIGTKTSLYVKT